MYAVLHKPRSVPDGVCKIARLYGVYLVIGRVDITTIPQHDLTVQLAQIQCLRERQRHNTQITKPMGVRQSSGTVGCRAKAVAGFYAVKRCKKDGVSVPADRLRGGIGKGFAAQLQPKRQDKGRPARYGQRRKADCAGVESDILHTLHTAQPLVLVYKDETARAVTAHGIAQRGGVVGGWLFGGRHIGQRCQQTAEILDKEVQQV